MPLGGSCHGALVCGGDFDAVGGGVFVEEVKGVISEVDGASGVCDDTAVVREDLEGIMAGDGG